MPALRLRPELITRLKPLLDSPLQSPERLQQEIAKHARVIEIVSRSRPLPVELAHALVRGLTGLLQGLSPETPAEQRHLIQTACRYFVESEDGGSNLGDHDLASDSGLDDDAEVFVAVACAVGREDLVAEVSRLLAR